MIQLMVLTVQFSLRSSKIFHWIASVKYSIAGCVMINFLTVV